MGYGVSTLGVQGLREALDLTMYTRVNTLSIVTPKRPTNFRIDSELMDGLESLRDKEGIPVSEQVRRAIRKWLESKGVTVKSPKRRAETRRKG